ncbi:MAG: PilC/PilY family type IV pilus protein [Proteobacteria bacterium]|nr:PilC/PilY family type IV pilus protein [Pseudomonadota bacterium]
MMICSPSFRKRVSLPLAVFMILQGGWPVSSAVAQSTLQIADVPSLSVSGSAPNVLLVMDNSNSMDMAPDGSTSWSSDPASRSYIARAAARQIIADYGSKMNIGLMAYQQNSDPQPYKAALKTFIKDVSFASSAGGRTASVPNPWRTTNRVYYNPANAYALYHQFSSQTVAYYTARKTAWPPDAYGVFPTILYHVIQGKTDTSDTPTNYSTYANYWLNEYGPSARIGYVGWVNNNWSGCYGAPTPYTVDEGCSYFSGADVGGSFKPYHFGHWILSQTYGWAWVSDDVSSRSSNGFLHVPIAAANPGSAQANWLNLKLANPRYDYGTNGGNLCNTPGCITYVRDQGGWRDKTKPLQNAGSTPMAGTLITARNYFTNGLTAGAGANDQTVQTSPKPVVGECGNNFVVFLTDGMPTVRSGGNVGAMSSEAVLNNDVISAVSGLRNRNIKTYFIGFGNEVNPATLDSFAREGGTEASYSAMNAEELKDAMDSIFSDIMVQSSSYAAVATNSSYLGTDSAVYQGSYNAGQWNGDVVAIKLNPNTGEATTQQWSAAAAMPAYGSRSIFTYNSTEKTGRDFAWDALDADQQTALQATPSGVAAIGGADRGKNMLNYLAGDKTHQGVGANKYRNRSTLLGDIVNSAPVYVGKPEKRYPDTIESASYYDWTDSVSRASAIYVGANDGMLHAFMADTGKEVFAYIPSMVYKNLPLLASQNYEGLHKFFVDGTPSVADAHIQTSIGGLGGKGWRTILVGGLNAGGQGIYALDITSPTAFDANKVLWEFTDRETSTETANQRLNYDRDLGYTFSAPSIVKTGDGWVAVFGNGYNNTVNDGDNAYSTTGNAVLYVVDLETGVIKKKLDTGRGHANAADNKPNGLSTPVAIDINNDGVVDYVYAGDLQGNLWKFDLNGGDKDHWNIANGGQPLFTAKSASGLPQPITVKPEVARHPQGGTMVLFGTGKLFETNDAALTAPVNTFYGIWDKGSAVSGGRNDLQQQEITKEMSAHGSHWRLLSSHPVDWNNKSGWYLDLAYPSTSLGVGERLIGNPVLNGERIVFVTITPTAGECSAGGYSWLMELDFLTGGRLTTSPFDVNKDGAFDEGDYLDGPDTFGPGGPGPGGSPKKQPAGGKREEGLMSAPNIIKGSGKPGSPPEIKHMNTSAGVVISVTESKGQADRRVSWRDISTQ